MTVVDVLEVLDRLDTAEVWWCVDGGWGVDALLREETRTHDDLDLVLDRRDVARLTALFPHFSATEQEWWPARFVLRNGIRQVDFHPVEFDGNGDGWQELLDGTRGRYPAEGLTGRGVIGGRHVRCITAQLQLEHHIYERGRPDDVDWQDVQLLCKRFELELPAAYAVRPGFTDSKRTRARIR